MTPLINIPLMQPQTECKVCGGQSLLHGVVDFTKNCNSRLIVQLSGMPVYYYQCEECQFLFTRAFDSWDIHAFNTHIYNENYGLFDPDYSEVRPTNYARDFAMLLSPLKPELKGLDYGGGSGLMAKLLREEGYNYISWDPMDEGVPAPTGPFNFISAIEVAEHVPEPKDFFAAIAAFLAEDGVCAFTTNTIDMTAEARLTDWWYVGPLNGHISIYSKPALVHLANSHGLQIRHVLGLHLLYRKASPMLTGLLEALAALENRLSGETTQPS